MSSIHRYLVTRQLAALAVLFGAGAVLLYVLVRGALLAQFDAALEARAVALQAFTKQTAGGVEWEAPPGASTSAESGGWFQLRLTDGAVLRSSAALGTNSLPWLAEAGTAQKVFNCVLPGGEPGRALAVRYTPFADKADRRPERVRERQPRPEFTPVTADLVVADGRAPLERTLRAVLLALGGTGVFLFVGTVVVVALSLRRGLAPLEELADRSARIDATSLATRFPTDALPAELRPIAGRWNELLARLEESFARERRFSDDIAHELRTPIGELRAQAEVALKLNRGDRATNEDALEIARRMEGIVNRLFDLARCEQGRLPLRPEPVLLNPLVTETWSAFSRAAGEKRLSVTMDIPADCRVQTDVVLLRAILTNLLANAAEYTPPDGEIAVRLQLAGPRLALTVSNTTADLRREDLPRLFERFWRKDAARSSAEHSGLGLSVSEAFARHLGCTLTAGMPADGWLVLTLSGLPAASA